MSALSYAAVIPCYNHGRALYDVLSRLEPFSIPTYVVDDGNCAIERELIDKALAAYPRAVKIALSENRGKGGAFIEGCTKAFKDGFTHAVQLDADGQHAIEDLPKLLALSKAHPHDVVCADPVYDASAPKARLYGRKITNFWMALETMSLAVCDGMCGFRIYPLKELVDLATHERISPRMGFDIDVLVRLIWRGAGVRFVKSAVTYPKDGVSNFHALRDNLTVSLVHTRLCLMAPYRLALMYLKRHSHE